MALSRRLAANLSSLVAAVTSCQRRSLHSRWLGEHFVQLEVVFFQATPHIDERHHDGKRGAFEQVSFDQVCPLRAFLFGALGVAVTRKVNQCYHRTVFGSHLEKRQLPGTPGRRAGAYQVTTATKRVEQAAFSDVRAARKRNFHAGWRGIWLLAVAPARNVASTMRRGSVAKAESMNRHSGFAIDRQCFGFVSSPAA